MTIGSLIFDDGQVEFNGYLLGDNEITFMDELTGWDDLPPVTSGNVPRPSDHGSFVGRKLAQERIITWSGTFAPDKSEWVNELKKLRKAFTISEDTTEIPIVVRLHDEVLTASGQVINRALPGNREYGAYVAPLSIQFACSDPRRYSITQQSSSVNFPSQTVTTGLVYPLSYPLDYGSQASIPPSSLVLTNGGDAPAPAVITIHGPVTNPVITNVNTGVFLEFQITLADSDYLTIDSAAGTVRLNDVVDRLYTRTVDSSPLRSFFISPNDTNIQITADSWSSGSYVSFVWRDANW